MTKQARTGKSAAGGVEQPAQPEGFLPGSYAEAAEELEDLLDQLEGADVDVDLLAQQVARGVQLIRFCRARLEVVTADVEEVVAELISVDGGEELNDGGDAEDPDDPEDEAE